MIKHNFIKSKIMILQIQVVSILLHIIVKMIRFTVLNVHFEILKLLCLFDKQINYTTVILFNHLPQPHLTLVKYTKTKNNKSQIKRHLQNNRHTPQPTSNPPHCIFAP